ncbi:hypothetical protein HELRODRAFT_188042 [Helobdella robusta]|uniref:PH domain-containing protein n=1 Tax=Helobdella robusta TaxID=6412 RepID=T1FPK7_HELRO|nr:hypothetical protein HELRODRAFT_188042 [Helobdella robusta]ESO12926.1 hypothetical protein HELRODRAFT_188042 [Helobdella robusta]
MLTTPICEVVKEGLVSVKVKSYLSSTYKHQWLRLLRQYDVYVSHKLEFHEKFSDCDHKPPLCTVPLFPGDRAHIESKGSRCGILLHFTDGNIKKFITQSLYDAEVWMHALNGVTLTLPPPPPTVFCQQSPPTTPLPPTPTPQPPMCSRSSSSSNIIVQRTSSKPKMRESAFFNVVVMPCAFLPWREPQHCRLEITGKELVLWSFENLATFLIKWNSGSIQKYGFDPNHFIIHTDRRSACTKKIVNPWRRIGKFQIMKSLSLDDDKHEVEEDNENDGGNEEDDYDGDKEDDDCEEDDDDVNDK